MEFRNENGRLRAMLTGEIDHHSAKKICEEIDIQLYAQTPNALYLDFTRVTFMDSSGLAVVAGRKRVCNALKIKAFVVNISGYPEKILKMSGAQRIIDFLEENNEN